MKTARCLVLVVASVLLAVTVTTAVHVGRLPCGGTIPVDSQFLLDPTWSLTAYRDAIQTGSGVGLTVSSEPLSSSLKQVIEAESGMNPSSVIVFTLQPEAGASNSTCVFYADPLRAAMAGTIARSARFVVLQAQSSANGVCVFPLTVSLSPNSPPGTSSSNLTIDIQVSGQEVPLFSPSVSFGVDSMPWPVVVNFSTDCEVSVLLLVNREGDIRPWYVWIPTTVFTAVVTVLLLPTVLARSRLPAPVVGIFIMVVFLGFFGCCVGLVIELLSWQSALGRMFPFPASVTLYCCLTVLYILYFIPLVYRSGHNSVLLMGVLRLLVYGLNCALCVGFWVAGYVVLGSLALFQYVVTNGILTWYFAWVSVRLQRPMTRGGSDPTLPNAFVYLWFAPFTPFAPCALLYFDLYCMTSKKVRMHSERRIRDVIYLYNAQMSLPLLLFQNVYGVAVLAAATAFHMPLIIVLFVALFMWGIHAVYTIEQYAREQRRWKRRGLVRSGIGCGLVSVDDALDYLLEDSSNAPGRRQKPSHGDDDLSNGGGDEWVQGAQGNVTPQYNGTELSPTPGAVPPEFNEALTTPREYRVTTLTTPFRDGTAVASAQRGYVTQDLGGGLSTPSQRLRSQDFWPSSVER